MLVFSRHPQESFKIGDDVTVTVCHVAGNVVKIGVEAPKHINIVRTELLTVARSVSDRDASLQEAAL